MITEIARSAIRDHGSGLIFHGIRVLESTEFAPRLVELAAHGQHTGALAKVELRLNRKLVVSAPGRRQILQLLLSVQIEQSLSESNGVVNMGGRVEVDRRFRVGFQNEVPQFLHVGADSHCVAEDHSIGVLQVHSLCLKPL